jgi:hypothetical protein
VVPVLDGLDEVAAEHRTGCVQAINRFWESHRGGPLVVCSRTAEYEELPERLKVGGGVTVCPPEADQIDRYLAAAGSAWDPVRAELLQDGSSRSVRELLATPLMLSIAVLAYLDHDPRELCEDDAKSQRGMLWSRYVSAVTTRAYDLDSRTDADAPDPYGEEDVQRWLGWLASEMRARDETELWLHEWTGPPSFRRKVRISIGTVLALILVLPVTPINLDAFGINRYVLAPIVGALLMLGGDRVLKPAPAYRVPFNADRLPLLMVVGGAGGLLLGLPIHLAGWLRPVMAGLDLGVLFVLAGGQGVTREVADRVALNRRRLPGFFVAALVVGVLLLVGRLGGFGSGTGSRALEAFAGGLVAGVTAAYALQRGLARRLPFKPRRVARLLARRFLVGLLFLGAWGLMIALVKKAAESVGAAYLVHQPAAALLVESVSGLVIAAGGGLILALVNFAPDRRRVAPRSPTQLTAESGKIGLVVGLAAGLLAALALSLPSLLRPGPLDLAYRLRVGVFASLSVGLPVALVTGLGAVLYQFAFRLWLRRHGNGPLRWVSFLEWACTRLLLRSTGAAYEWAHLELRDYMAEQHPSQR